MASPKEIIGVGNAAGKLDVKGSTGELSYYNASRNISSTTPEEFMNQADLPHTVNVTAQPERKGDTKYQ